MINNITRSANGFALMELLISLVFFSLFALSQLHQIKLQRDLSYALEDELRLYVWQFNRLQLSDLNLAQPLTSIDYSAIDDLSECSTNSLNDCLLNNLNQSLYLSKVVNEPGQYLITKTMPFVAIADQQLACEQIGLEWRQPNCLLERSVVK